MRAHSANQLRAKLGMTPEQFGRGRVVGLIPPPDLRTPRWSGTLTAELVERRADILAGATPEATGLFSVDDLMRELSLSYGELRRACEAGVIPEPASQHEDSSFWSSSQLDDLRARGSGLREAIPPPPVGARRCAEQLAARIGLDVQADDVQALAAAGVIQPAGYYKQWPLYDVSGLADDAAALQSLVEQVTEREAWIAGSLTSAEAAAVLRCHERDLRRVAWERGIEPGRFDRYPREQVEAVAGDEDAMQQICRSRLLGPNQAAEHLELRRSDFDVLVTLGWVRAVDQVERKLSPRTVIRIPLYRTGDLEDLLAEPPERVDWDAVRGARPGEISPLRAYL